MRVHYLFFLASSALPARIDSVLEPAGPAAVRSSTDKDNDVSVTRLFTSDDDPLNADERGFPGNFLSAVPSKVGEMVKTVTEGKKRKVLETLLSQRWGSSFESDFEHALKTPELTRLYDRYQKSGKLMIDDLMKLYGADKIARVLSGALKPHPENPASFANPETLVEKLAMDQLISWKKQKKKLDDVFAALKLNEFEVTTSDPYLSFVSRRMKVLADYSKYTVTKNSEVAYLDTVMIRFGGKENFLSMLNRAKRDRFFFKQVDDLENIILKACLAKDTSPKTAFKMVGLASRKEGWFDMMSLLKMETYVHQYNKNKPFQQQTTVLAVLKKELGGEAKLLTELVKVHPDEHLTEKLRSYENQIYGKWKSAGIRPDQGLLERIQYVDGAVQGVIKDRYKVYIETP